MKINPNAQAIVSNHHKVDKPVFDKTPESDLSTPIIDIPEEEPAIVIEISPNVSSTASLANTEKEKRINILKPLEGEEDDKKSKKNDEKQSKVNDASGKLMKRLASARSKSEVQQVMAEANKNLSEALNAAANGDPNAINVVNKLQSLLNRVNRTIRAIDSEAEKVAREKLIEERKSEQAAKAEETESDRREAEKRVSGRKNPQDVAAAVSSDNKGQKSVIPEPMPKEQFEAMKRALDRSMSRKADIAVKINMSSKTPEQVEIADIEAMPVNAAV